LVVNDQSALAIVIYPAADPQAGAIKVAERNLEAVIARLRELLNHDFSDCFSTAHFPKRYATTTPSGGQESRRK
jgi:hypothetical protein